MGLTSDLISEFVKITKDDVKEKKETIVYGTAVVEGDKKYVRLDGSNLLTPISATADTINGERVIVMIKNHTATITGNITSPAARVSDVRTAIEGVEKVGSIEELVDILSDVVIDHDDDIIAIQKQLATVKDFIIESGTNDIWSYEKWASGKLVCWGRYSGTAINASKNNEDGCYQSDPITVEFPVIFSDIPVISVNGGSASRINYIREKSSTQMNASFVVICHTSDQTSVDVSVSIHAIGTYATAVSEQ